MASFVCAGASLPDNIFSVLPAFFPFLASSLAFLAASRAKEAFIILRTKLSLCSLFSSNQYDNFSETTASTACFAWGVPSFPFVCPSNCNKSSGTETERIDVKPSRTSLPSKFLSFSFNKPYFLA